MAALTLIEDGREGETYDCGRRDPCHSEKRDYHLFVKKSM